MLRLERIPMLILCIGILCIVDSCAPRKIIIQPKEIPRFPVKIYPLSGVDWSKLSKFTLDLQEVGSPEKSRNQILEKYLFMQITDCLKRKGYHSQDEDFDVRIRLYFEVKEEREYVTATQLAYGVVGTYQSSLFLTSYGLSSGIWRTATLVPTAWSAYTKADMIYKGSISIEVFDREGLTQLWRGDIEAPLLNDDIRVCSNWMIRELLWHFPAIDYPPVPMKELRPNEIDEFWRALISGCEFFSPGQRYALSFVDSCLDTASVSLEEAKAEFAKSKAYQQVKETVPIFQKVEESRAYKRAFEEWLGPITSEVSLRRSELRTHYREFAAIYDLLTTAPWSLKSEDGTIFLAGRYFIGSDETPTIIGIEAEPRTYKIISTESSDFMRKKYFVTNIATLGPSDFEMKWERVREYRKMAVGVIDFVPEKPAPAARPTED